jgi:hypothetical protein
MAVRLEKCARQESAATAVRVRQSAFEFEDSRIAEVEALFSGMLADPAGVVRKLHRTPEGIARLIQGWDWLRDRLIHPTRGVWNHGNRDWAERYSGRQPGLASSRIGRLTRAIDGDFSALEPHEGAGLDEPARRAWAVGQMVELIDNEIAALQAAKESFGPNFTAIERAEAADIALFDSSKPAILARKYEAAAERTLFRALREFRQVEAEAAEQVDSNATTQSVETCEELASSLPEPEGELIEAEPVASPRPERVENGSPDPSRGRIPSVQGPNTRGRERPVAA